ncbi:unnamed protein product [Dimorphilus gyrociliatus]|uniref:RING-type domain-containing protein n=1 Tax=Dimorphilus gyrociliatus TaxID=2664684 RepID=A0A7I8VEP4_9ANNE|nr:unnamed protein product [Dimorphilus gyrociliatus]
MSKKNLLFSVDERKMKCELCLTSWYGNTPKVLNCEHTFCSSCLESIVLLFFVRCPTCNKVTDLEMGGVEHLPNHFIDNDFPLYEEEVCNIHNRTLLYPKLVCVSCKKILACIACIDLDHTKESCSIRSYDSAYQSQRQFRREYISKLNEAEESFLANILQTTVDIESMERSWHSKLSIKLSNIIDTIDNYEQNILKVFKRSLKKAEYPLTTEDVEKELKMLEDLMIDIFNQPKLIIKLGLEFNESINSVKEMNNSQQMCENDGKNVQVHDLCQ